jgi:hypothetical protein
MEQSPSREANTSVVSQYIPRILWNPTVHCRIHKSSSPVCILIQISPVQYQVLMISYNIFIQCTSIGLQSDIGSTRSVEVWEEDVLA